MMSLRSLTSQVISNCSILCSKATSGWTRESPTSSCWFELRCCLRSSSLASSKSELKNNSSVKFFATTTTTTTPSTSITNRVKMAPPTHTPQERPVDEVQLKLMEELCIVVSEKDEVIGYDTKKKCHLMTNIKDGLLHRAFSVFLFNSDGKLLLQKRADEKITFPAYWTNTCCSHPLYYMQEGDQSTYSVSYSDELEERDQLGVKRAAQRKLNHELGINVSDVATDDFTFLTRIHYLASSDDIWGEHEVDYVLFLRKDIAVNPNPNEVSAVKYVDQTELKEMIKSAEAGEIKLTPWFSLIKDNFLFKWWDALLKNDIASQADPTTIHKL